MDQAHLWADYVVTPPSLNNTPPSLLSGFSSKNGSNGLIINDPSICNILCNIGMDEFKNRMPTYSETPSNESQETRSLYVSNVNPETTDSEIQNAFNKNGGLCNVNKDFLDNGCLVLDYYDLREAHSMKMLYNGSILHGNILSVHSAPIKQPQNLKKPQNNGTIVIFHLKENITDDHIRSIFGGYGEIRMIRSTPTNKNQKFVEYWDIRAAKRALNAMNGRYVMGNRVKIEFSTPGGQGRIARAHPGIPAIPSRK